MNANIDGLISRLSKILIPNGDNEVVVIFHNSKWTDILLKNSLVGHVNKLLRIDETGFLDILRSTNTFPAYGQVEYKFNLENKNISNISVKIINRIHNGKDKIWKIKNRIIHMTM